MGPMGNDILSNKVIYLITRTGIAVVTILVIIQRLLSCGAVAQASF